MNILLIVNLLGKALMVEGALMLPSALIAIYYGGGDAQALFLTAAISCCAGALLSLLRPRSDSLRAREGFAAVALIWVLLSFFGGLPFYLSGAIPSITDSFFECVSGFTTTGASILTDVEALPRGLMFWRSFTHWVGGMGVLVLSLAILPRMGARSLYLLRAESTGPAPGKLVPRIGRSAKILYLMYLLLSLLQAVVLCALGMDLYDSLIHTFGTAGTGGFSNYAASVGHFNSPAVDAVIASFMLLFGVNFSLYFLLLHGDLKSVWKNEELRVYLGAVLVSVAVIALNILPQTGSFSEALRQSYFQVSSVITTTGFATTDFNLWPELSRTILVLLMLLGACAGSTGGGLKAVRALLLFKSMRRDLVKSMRPRVVRAVKMDGHVVEEGVLSQVQVFFFAYLALILAATLIVSADGFSFETNFTAALSAVSNIGPGLGAVGPTGSFAGFSNLSKWVLSFCMLAGRLEVYPMLMLFSADAWRRN